MIKITDPAQLPDKSHYVVSVRNTGDKIAKAEIIPADTITLAKYQKHRILEKNGERKDAFVYTAASKPTKWMLQQPHMEFEMHETYSPVRDYHEYGNNVLPIPVRKGSRD